MARLDPLGATTRGLGEVIRAAIGSGGVRSLVIGLGGSASTDGAAGALSALGLTLLDEQGDLVPDGGGSLPKIVGIHRAEFAPPPPDGVTLLTDVTAPLLGPTGAAAVFGPQKGASPEEVAQLDAALAHFSRLLGGDPLAPGTGAAGGAGYGFAAAWGARIESGADYLAGLSGLSTTIERADLLLTGEGRFDEQSLTGKVVGQLLDAADRTGVTAGVIAGQVTAQSDVWTASLTELAGSVDAAMGDPATWLREAGAAAARELSPA
jgi:glycerate kinase